jgi:hypothetical protein
VPVDQGVHVKGIAKIFLQYLLVLFLQLLALEVGCLFSSIMREMLTKRKESQLAPLNGDGLRISEAADLIGVSQGTMRNYLPFLKTWMLIRPGQTSGIRYVSRASLEEFMKGNIREGI